jgi:putative transcriptional regulator
MKKNKPLLRMKKKISSLTKPKVGSLLISEPFNPEPTFKRSVVLISQHSSKGSIGFIINKPTQLKVYEALDDFPEFDAPVYWGGALKLDSIYYLHSLEHLPGAIKLAEGVYWGGDYQQLKVMIEAGEVTTEDIKFLAGYSAWPSKQLEKEISLDNWWVTDADQYSVLVAEPTIIWGKMLTSMGHVYGIMNDFPEDPSLN